MLFLILSIVSSTLITVFMRISEGKSKNEISLLSMNYLSCCLLSYLFMENKTLFPRESAVSTVLYLGVIGGVLYLASFLLLKWNVRKNGVTLPATFMKLGVLVPTVLAAVIFREKLHAATVLGILLALVAILLLKEKSSEKAKNTFGLILLLAGGGMADAMSKIFEETAPQSLSNHFLFYIFFVALLLSAGLVIVKKQKYHPYDVAFGLLIGIPNYFSSRFLLLSLRDIPAVVAYPTFSAGTIILVAVLGKILFKESFTKKKLIALSVILVSLALLNLPG
ncbi:MAG: EamA family transporter [Clostridia bacterium]|nr:EamA family transporter [Clostridia bacterium]MBQ5771571.1 EamA family transporter [Clostridia bacterium]